VGDGIRGVLRKLGPFTVQSVLGDVRGPDRLKRTQTDVKGDESPVDGALLQPFEESRSKMEPGCRGGDGARLPGEHGLVARTVLLVGAASANVGRERHLAAGLQEFEHPSGLVGLCQPMTEGGSAYQLKLQRSRFHDDRLASYKPATRLTHDFPQPLRELSQKEPFPFAAGSGATADKAGRHYLGIIKDQHVPRGQQLGQFIEDVVRQSTGSPVEHQQASQVTLGTRLLGDEVSGELVIKEFRASNSGRGSLGGCRPLPGDHLKPFSHSSKPFLY
jgi:hypothetical protein